MSEPFVKGPVNAVPCPRCGAKNDFSEIMEHIGHTSLDRSQVTGQMVLCDHCNQKMEICGVQTVTIIATRVPQ